MRLRTPLVAAAGTLVLAACSATPDGARPSVTANPTPTTATSSPQADPTAVASRQVRAAFADYLVQYAKTATGSPGADPGSVATGKLLRNIQVGFRNQHDVGNVITGSTKAYKLRIDRVHLGSHPTVQLTTCLLDGFTARNSRTKKVVLKPGGKYLWHFTYVKQRGTWLAAAAKVDLPRSRASCA